MLALAVLQSLGSRLSIRDATELRNRSHIDFDVPSYPVAVLASVDTSSFFDAADRDLYLPHVKRNAESTWPGEVRGVPPNNWVKFRVDGAERGLFVYKTVHRCAYISSLRKGGWIFDSLAAHEIRTPVPEGAKKDKSRNRIAGKMRKAAVESFITRLAAGPRLHVHSLTTPLAEAYQVKVRLDLAVCSFCLLFFSLC